MILVLDKKRKFYLLLSKEDIKTDSAVEKYIKIFVFNILGKKLKTQNDFDFFLRKNSKMFKGLSVYSPVRKENLFKLIKGYKHISSFDEMDV